MPQFHKEAGQILGVEQRPASARTDSRSRLQRLDPCKSKLRNGGLHIGDFEQHMVEPSAFLFEEFAVCVPLSFKRLNKLQLQISDLDESLANLDWLFFAFIPILGVRPVRPFDESKGADTKDLGEQSRCALQITNYDTDLHRTI